MLDCLGVLVSSSPGCIWQDHNYAFYCMLGARALGSMPTLEGLLFSFRFQRAGLTGSKVLYRFSPGDYYPSM